MCESRMHYLVYNNHYYNIVSLTLQEELVCLSSIKMWRIGTESANLTYVATAYVCCLCTCMDVHMCMTMRIVNDHKFFALYISI